MIHYLSSSTVRPNPPPPEIPSLLLLDTSTPKEYRSASPERKEQFHNRGLRRLNEDEVMMPGGRVLQDSEKVRISIRIRISEKALGGKGILRLRRGAIIAIAVCLCCPDLRYDQSRSSTDVRDDCGIVRVAATTRSFRGGLTIRPVQPIMDEIAILPAVGAGRVGSGYI